MTSPPQASDSIRALHGTLAVAVPRHLTERSVPGLEARIVWDHTIEAVLDFAACDFVSSAGIRFVLSVHQRMLAAGGRVRVTNLHGDVAGVFEVTGLAQILHLEHVDAEPRPPREISIDGIKPFSAGVCGECFRIGPEKIVKLYRDGVSPAVAEQEKRLARQAFIMGIPTAISFDMVSCRGRVGVEYEMLEAELFSDVIRRDPDDVERYAEMLAEVMGKVHAAGDDLGDLPVLRDRIRDNIESVRGELPDADVDLLQARLAAVPGEECCVHFDLHSSNIMLRRGRPIIVDMGDLSRGSPWFDVAVVFMIYGVPELGLCELATGIPTAHGLRLWEAFKRRYLADRPERDREYLEQHGHFLAALRLLCAFEIAPTRKQDFIAMIRDVLLPRMKSPPRLR
ncbi:MAG: phosphotransferase [Phycisphaerales bacterium]